MAVILDIRDGDVSRDTDGLHTSRIVRVTSLSGDAATRLYNAMNASGVPRYGEPHPSIPHLRAISISAAPDEAGARITVNYGQPTFEQKEPNETEQPIIQVGSTLQESQTSKDKDDNLIFTEFTYTPVDEDGNQGEEITEKFVPVLALQTAQTAVEYQRRENANPLQKSLLYVGKVNSVGIGLFAARTLLCTGIEGQSNDGGISYSVGYRFQYNPRTWDVEFFYIDQETGQPHKDVTISPANGYGTARLYNEIDMRPLNVI